MYSYAVSGAGVLFQNKTPSDVHYVLLFDAEWRPRNVCIEGHRLSPTGILITDAGDILNLSQGYRDEFGTWRFSITRDRTDCPKAAA